MAPLRPLHLILLMNGCVALLTGGVALLVLLIAPLGLAAVITCTILVTALNFVGGVLADLVLWRLLPMGRGASPVSLPWLGKRSEDGGGRATFMAVRPRRIGTKGPR